MPATGPGIPVADRGPSRRAAAVVIACALLAASLNARGNPRFPAALPGLRIVAPANLPIDRPAPVLVALHGTGETPGLMIQRWRQFAADAGMILVAPQGTCPSPAGDREWSEGDVDEAARVVDEALAAVRGRYTVAEDRIVVTGYSQGANLALLLGLRRPDLAGVIAVAGWFDPLRGERPADVATSGTRWAILVGDRDSHYFRNSSREAAAELDRAGAAVELRVLADLTHEFPRGRAADLRRALAFVLPTDAPRPQDRAE